ncbi:peptidoglycan-binding protein [Curtobacterium sp. MCSS17_006]|uniref:peptidoglycan-binding protein n=1 Tax=Curtobacterium sp. MCSS17_006 TaxID=2175642 RepID=UPI0015E8B543|nr:peptidoglycan-binding protein [Curtobacterium sp. MCSS17_006]
MTRPSGRRRTITAVCLAAALAVGTGAWAVLGLQRDEPASASASGQPHRATATVSKGDLTESKVFAGTLGYGAPTGVPGAAAGTITWLPEPGNVVRRDDPVYAVDEREVRSMYGTVPLWRDLSRGRDGTDVRQLNENLAALGYDVSVDEVFGPRTERAVRQWQADRGHRVTGVLTADDVAFVDGAVRVASVEGELGQATGAGAGVRGTGGPDAGTGGDVLQVTSTDRVVTATVSQRDAERLAVGTEVDVRINGTGDTLRGEVTDAHPSASEDGGNQVDVSVSFEPGDRKLPAAASAQIEAKGATARGVLSVPVAALVAGSGGGYAVDVVRRDATTKRVPVVPGFTADGRVAITGEVGEGERVVVPG